MSEFQAGPSAHFALVHAQSSGRHAVINTACHLCSVGAKMRRGGRARSNGPWAILDHVDHVIMVTRTLLDTANVAFIDRNVQLETQGV